MTALVRCQILFVYSNPFIPKFVLVYLDSALKFAGDDSEVCPDKISNPFDPTWFAHSEVCPGNPEPGFAV